MTFLECVKSPNSNRQGIFLFYMTEKFIPKVQESVVFQQATFINDQGGLKSTVINGQLEFSNITPLDIVDHLETSKAISACTCHMEGDKSVWFCAQGHEPPATMNAEGINQPVTNNIQIPFDERAIPLLSPENRLPYGVLVKNPVVATVLMEEVALTQLSRMEKAGVHSDDIEKRLNNWVSEIEDVSKGFKTPGAAKSARHRTMQYLRITELSIPALASAVIFAADKLKS